jgi:hypothetical protein
MLRLVALVRTDVSEELSASFIRVTRIGELIFLRSLRHRFVFGVSLKGHCFRSRTEERTSALRADRPLHSTRWLVHICVSLCSAQ